MASSPSRADALQVREVTGRRDLGRFIDLPYRLHGHEPTWVAPLRISERELFDPDKNPFFDHARMTLYLAERAGNVVGRIAAIDDDNHNAAHGENLLFFGFFEASDAATASALFEAVEAEGRRLGRDQLRGPVNPSMNDSVGFQIDGFDSPPYVMMPQTPPEYPALAERAGFTKIKDLYAWRYRSDKGLDSRFQRLADRVRERNSVTVRPADLSQLERELGYLKTIYNAAWEQNWGFVKYTDAEFDHLADELKMIIDPEIALFLECEGEVVATAVAIPDLNQVLGRFNGRLFPFGIVHLLRRRAIIDRARLAILGVLPAFRRRGFELLLIEEIARRGAARGYREGELSWILEDNHAINHSIEAAGAERYKTYRLYQKPL